MRLPGWSRASSRTAVSATTASIPPRYAGALLMVRALASAMMPVAAAIAAASATPAGMRPAARSAGRASGRRASASAAPTSSPKPCVSVEKYAVLAAAPPVAGSPATSAMAAADAMASAAGTATRIHRRGSRMRPVRASGQSR